MSSASILLVEDEALIRMMVEEMVEALGHTVVAVAGNVDDGRSLAEIEEYDLAILDINLQGFNVQPVAKAVTDRGLPFFFLSGYDIRGVPDGFENMPVLTKPCSPEALGRTIDFVLSNANTRRL
jgi:DNA-binding response OmpR family regulator